MPNHDILGDAKGNLASTYRSLGKFSKAKELEVVEVEKHKQVLGCDHPDTLRVIGNLAIMYGNLGKFQQAEELQVIVLEKQRQLLVTIIQTLLEPWGIWHQHTTI
jgi:hypothetical protein